MEQNTHVKPSGMLDIVLILSSDLLLLGTGILDKPGETGGPMVQVPMTRSSPSGIGESSVYSAVSLKVVFLPAMSSPVKRLVFCFQ